MLLKNFYRALAGDLCKVWGAVPYINVNGQKMENMPGNTNATCFGYEKANYYVPSMYYMKTQYGLDAGVIIGSGTTPPTADDYALSGDMITTYTYNADVKTSFEDDGVTFTGVYTITNIGESPFTVGEIALMAGLGNGPSKENKALIDRTVLENPITIEAGGIGQVTYTIRMDYPVA